MREIFQNKYWKRGSSEIFGFICLAPVVVMLVTLCISVVQVSSMKEKLEYSTYVACRAASVSSSLSNARKSAKEVAESNLAGYSNVIDGTVDVKISYAQGSKKKWQKGSYIECKVSVKVKTLSPYIKGEKNCKMIMAIEKPEG